MITIDVIAGARPNFMKIAALFAVASEFPDLRLRLVHTGQHYDAAMSDIFMNELNIPEPVCHLGVGGGSHAVQTAEVMIKYEKWIINNRPDIVLVVGDVNSTLACAVVASKENVKIAHVEAGLRSFDKSMPEEINRIITDSICDYFYVTEKSALNNLIREGHSSKSIIFVGNVMVDTLYLMKQKADSIKAYEKYSLKPNQYAYITLHRPSNVDNSDNLSAICEQLIWLADRLPVVFPVHPRTMKNLVTLSLENKLLSHKSITLTSPVGYLESLSLQMYAKIIITDSGGIQEESAVLHKKCLTLRENTERPITIEYGNNVLIGNDWNMFKNCINDMDNVNCKIDSSIPFWDGNAAKRILKHLSSLNI